MRLLNARPLLLAAAAALIFAADRQAAADELFPPELVEFTPGPQNPVFEALGPGTWEVKIRERGWILREGNQWHLWYTGYDGTRAGLKMPGHATSCDGIHWTRDPLNPLIDDEWVEDMMVVRDGSRYLMFAEGRGDRAHLLESPDGRHWTHLGRLDVRLRDGRPIPEGPYGTPTAWKEPDAWYLLYERGDLGIWLAASRDLKTWTNVDDEPVLKLGADGYDDRQIAPSQVVELDGRYYLYYHASSKSEPAQWTTALAVSTDRVHWTKYPGNPILRENKSSPVLVDDGCIRRLYTMHERVIVHFPRRAVAPAGDR